MLETVLQFSPWLQSEWLVGLVLFAVTFTLIAFGVPGVVIPLSFSSGALLGGWLGVAVVAGGVLAGSQALFWIVRHVLQDRIRLRLGERGLRFAEHLGSRGLIYVLVLRIAGAPHFLVTAGSAVAKVRAAPFAAASLLGFLPVIAVTAAAGAAV